MYFSLCELQSAKHDAWDCSRPVSLWKPGSYHFSSDLIGRLAAQTYEFWQAAQLNVRDVDQKSELSSIDEFRFMIIPQAYDVVATICTRNRKSTSLVDVTSTIIYFISFHTVRLRY